MAVIIIVCARASNAGTSGGASGSLIMSAKLHLSRSERKLASAFPVQRLSRTGVAVVVYCEVLAVLEKMPVACMAATVLKAVVDVDLVVVVLVELLVFDAVRATDEADAMAS